MDVNLGCFKGLMAKPFFEQIGTYALVCFGTGKGVTECVTGDFFLDTCLTNVAGNELFNAAFRDWLTIAIEKKLVMENMRPNCQVGFDGLRCFLLKVNASRYHAFAGAHM